VGNRDAYIIVRTKVVTLETEFKFDRRPALVLSRFLYGFLLSSKDSLTQDLLKRFCGHGNGPYKSRMSTFTLEFSYTITDLFTAAVREVRKSKTTVLTNQINTSLQRGRHELLNRLIDRVLCYRCVANDQRIDVTRKALTQALREAIERFTAVQISQKSESCDNLPDTSIDLLAYADAYSETCAGHLSSRRRCRFKISRARIKEDIERFGAVVKRAMGVLDKPVNDDRLLDRKAHKLLETVPACMWSITSRTDEHPSQWTPWPDLRRFTQRRSVPQARGKTGHLYVFRDRDISSAVKIGEAVDVDKRLKKIFTSCGRKPELVEDPKQRPVRHVYEAEQLVFAALSQYQRCLYCKGCNGTHYEWFMIDKQRALKEIELARKAMEKKYGTV
jgi:hypothetical protein